MKNLELQKKLDKKSMFISALLTYALAAIFLIISFIFNGRFIIFPKEPVYPAGTPAELMYPLPMWIRVVAVLLKSGSIILFFFFMMISIGNYRELRGYIMTWREMLVLLIVSILQSSTEIYVFFITALGITLVITYMYFIQGKVNVEYGALEEEEEK